MRSAAVCTVVVAWVVVGLLSRPSAAAPPLAQYQITPLELRGELIRDIQVHPTTPNVVYLVGQYAGVYRSDDHGDNWTHLLRIDGRGLGIDRRNPDTLYAGGFGGVFRTDDAGRNWRRVLDQPVRSVGVHPVSGVIFAGGDKGIMHRSDDGGVTWTRPAPAGDGEINKWAFHPTDAHIVYHSAAKNRGVYRSQDGGRTFALLQEEYGRCVSLAPSDPRVLYSSRTMSRDGGAIWQPAGGGSAWAVAIHPDNPDIVYKATQGDAVYATHDGGQNWRLVRGLRRGDPTGLTAHWSAAYDGKNDIVYIGAAVLYKAHRASRPDAELVEAGVGIITPHVRSLAQAGPSIWAATDGQGVARSIDHGRTWQRKLLGLRGKLNLSALSVHPANSNLIYAAGEGGLVRTTNGGETWALLPSPGYVNYGTGLVLDPENADRLYLLAGRSEGQVFVATDGGYTWTPWRPLADRKDIRRFLLHPTRRGVFLAQSPGIGMRSEDGGASWKTFDLPADGALVVSARPQTPNTYYLLRDQQGAWRSDDAGVTWRQIIQGGRVGAGKFIEAGDGTIWLGNAASLMRSSDGGTSWESLTMPAGINALLLDPHEPGNLFVGLQAGMTWVHRPGAARPPVPARPQPKSAPEHKVISISEGGLLDRPNTTYRLTHPLTTPATAFFITADNVTLDGGGHEVVFDHCGVHATGVRGLTVRNIILRQSGDRPTSHGTAHVVDAAFCDDVTIDRVTVSAAHRGTAGIMVQGERARIENSTVQARGVDGGGIIIVGDDAVVRNNRVSTHPSARPIAVQGERGMIQTPMP